MRTRRSVVLYVHCLSYVHASDLNLVSSATLISDSVFVCVSVFNLCVNTYTSTYVLMCVYTAIGAYMYMHIYIYIYTGCPRRNVADFGRVFLMLKYTDITQNTYVQS